jgi:hypothetical protein
MKRKEPDEEFWEFEKIVSHIKDETTGETLYEVKWKDYDRLTITNCPNIII